eukprot:s1734_g2.t1
MSKSHDIPTFWSLAQAGGVLPFSLWRPRLPAMAHTAAWAALLAALALQWTGVDAYARLATAVTGEVVKGAGNLTMGGKVGTYTVLLQVLNPEYGPLRLLMECCGENQNLVNDMVTKVNAHEVYGPKGKHRGKDALVSEYQGRCSQPGIRGLLEQGKPECSYFYMFQNKADPDNTFTAWSVPEDICSTDVSGTRGLIAGYQEFLQTLNALYGELVYAGKGNISSVLNGMNIVNEGNLSSFVKEKRKYLDIFGLKIPIGKTHFMKFEGVKQLGIMDMLSACNHDPSEGILYVFDNRMWSNSTRDLNATEFLKSNAARKGEKTMEELRERIRMIERVLPKKAVQVEKQQAFFGQSFYTKTQRR